MEASEHVGVAYIEHASPESKGLSIFAGFLLSQRTACNVRYQRFHSTDVGRFRLIQMMLLEPDNVSNSHCSERAQIGSNCTDQKQLPPLMADLLKIWKIFFWQAICSHSQ